MGRRFDHQQNSVRYQPDLGAPFPDLALVLMVALECACPIVQKRLMVQEHLGMGSLRRRMKTPKGSWRKPMFLFSYLLPFVTKWQRVFDFEGEVAERLSCRGGANQSTSAAPRKLRNTLPPLA